MNKKILKKATFTILSSFMAFGVVPSTIVAQDFTISELNNSTYYTFWRN